MRVTRQQLNEMINEEISRALLRSENRGLVEARLAAGSGGIGEADVTDLLEFAKAYASLGTAVQEQLEDLIDDSTADVNPNAVELIKRKLGGMNDELDDALQAWQESYDSGATSEEEDDGTYAAAARINRLR